MKYFHHLFVTVLLMLFSHALQAQQEEQSPAFTAYPLPQFSVLLTDSVTTFTKANLPKGKQVLVMLFSPDCDHCKKETETIKANIKDFKNTHVLMVTSQPFEKMRAFYKEYGLADFKGITVGQDARFFFPSYYKIKFFPFLVFYDKKDQYRKHFEGTVKWEDMKALLKQ